MKKTSIGAAAALAIGLTGCATTYDWKPVTGEGEQVRYDRGRATTYFETPTVAVQVSPMGFNQENQVQFGVAVVNKTDHPVNFGFENVSLAYATGSMIAVYDGRTLERQAKNRAMIAAIAVGAAGAASAYAAANNSYSTTHGAIYTPRGAYGFRTTTYDPAAAALGVGAATAVTGAGLASISQRLQDTLSSIEGRILATTTIDPGQSYGGVVIGDRLKGAYPMDLVLTVRQDGLEHGFRFTVAQQTK